MEFVRALGDENYVEAIKDGEIVKVPESIAHEEDLFVLRRVIEAAPEVVEDQKKSGGVWRSHKLEEWKSGKFNLKKNNVAKDLVQNFHWHISRTRRMKGLSRKDLAEKVGATEEEMKMIEMGDLPKDDFVFINKVEKELEIELRKDKPAGGEVTLSDLQKMNEEKVQEVIEKTHERKTEEEGIVGDDDIEIIDLDD